MWRNRCVLTGIAILFGLGTAAAQQQTVPPGQQPPQRRERTRLPAEQAAPQSEGAHEKQAQHLPAPEEKSVVTHHSARIGGQTINYTATAATYNIKADDGTHI